MLIYLPSSPTITVSTRSGSSCHPASARQGVSFPRCWIDCPAVNTSKTSSLASTLWKAHSTTHTKISKLSSLTIVKIETANQQSACFQSSDDGIQTLISRRPPPLNEFGGVDGI